MVSAQDARLLYERLTSSGLHAWLNGGWGIDALLGEQTRPHKDLDIIILVDEVVQMRGLLERDGYSLAYLWSESLWVVDAQGIKVPTAFVLQDSRDREIDAHAMRLDAQGNGIPEWAHGAELVFSKQDLAAEGMIAGVMVRCFSPEMQVVCHQGYDLPAVHLHDLALLRERFGVVLPDKPSSIRFSVG